MASGSDTRAAAESAGAPPTWSVFVAYRHDDGAEAAEWLYRSLHRRPVESRAPEAPRLLLYYDQTAPAVSDWRSVHGRNLGSAAAFILVCSPGAAHEREGERDELYDEIRWWMSKRSSAPILVETVGKSGAWVPAPISRRWPDAQRLRVHADTWVRDGAEPTDEELRVRDRILDGIRWSQRRVMDDELAARRRRQRVLTGLLGALLVLFGLAVAALGYGCQQRRRADERAALAERSRTETLVRQGLDLCETGRTDLGLLWLAEARRTVPAGSPDLRAVLDAQLTAGAASLNRLEAQLPVGLPVRRIAWSSARARLAVGATGDGRTRVVVQDPTDAGGTWARGYDRALDALGFSPDGRYVIAGVQPGIAYVSESDAERAGTALEVGGEITAVDVSPDGRWIAIGTGDGLVCVRPFPTGTEEIRLQAGTQSGVIGLAFVHPGADPGLTGEGPELLVAYTELGPLLWHVTLQEHRSLYEDLGGEFGLAAFAYRPLRVAVAGKDAAGEDVVHLWRVRGESLHHVVVPSPAPVTSLALEPGPRGEHVLTGAADWQARLYAPDGRLLRSFRHGYGITDVCFVAGTTWVGTASQDLTAAVWDVETGRRVGSPLRHPRSPTAIRGWRADGRVHVVTGCWDGVARRWAVPPSARLGLPLRHEAACVHAAFVPGAQRAVTGGGDGRVVVWDLERGVALRELLPAGETGRIRCVAAGPEGTDVIAGAHEGAVRIWSTRVGERPTWNDPRSETIHDVDISPDGRWAAMGSQSGAALCWDLASGEVRPLATSHGIEGAVSVVRFSPGGRYLALGGEDDVVRVFDPTTGDEAAPLLDLGGNLLHAAFSPDERLLAAVGYGTHAVVWDLETGLEVHRLGPHEDHVDHVAFDGSGQYVVTASYDHTARVWHLGAEAELVAVLRHPGRVGVARFAPAGLTVFTGCADGLVREWDVETGYLLQTHTYGAEVLVLDARDASEGRQLLVSGRRPYALFWQLPRPRPRAEGATPASVERATGLHLGRDGAVRVLTPEAWRERVETNLTVPDNPRNP